MKNEGKERGLSDIMGRNRNGVNTRGWWKTYNYKKDLARETDLRKRKERYKCYGCSEVVKGYIEVRSGNTF